MTDTCVYCAQGGDPPTGPAFRTRMGYRRTCPGCGRSYLARFPRDVQQERESGASPAVSGAHAPFVPDLEPIYSNEVSEVRVERPATMSNVQHIEHSEIQGSLF
jgi:predicted  nucleic acid-binding Zn-ribbon protein